jgi:hypothetical protein
LLKKSHTDTHYTHKMSDSRSRDKKKKKKGKEKALSPEAVAEMKAKAEADAILQLETMSPEELALAALKLEEGEVVEYTTDSKHISSDTHVISTADVLSFCFPPHLEHPQATGRLFVLAECGPVVKEHSYLACLCDACKRRCEAARKESKTTYDIYHAVHHITPAMLEAHPQELSWMCNKCRRHCMSAVHVKSGVGGKHILSTNELDNMTAEIVREDILEAYNRRHVLNRLEADRFLELVTEQKGDQLHPLWSKAVVQEILKGIPKQEDGMMGFYAFRDAILKRRAEIIKNLGLMYPTVVQAEPQKKTYKAPRLGTYLRQNGRKVTDKESYVLTTRLLHKYAYNLNTSENKHLNNASAVYFLRDMESNSESNWVPPGKVRHTRR